MNKMTVSRQCWCSDSPLISFSETYAGCGVCGSLIYQGAAPSEVVSNDASDFYGTNYWFNHQTEDFGFPDIVERSKLDLPERCLFWLRHLLRYKLPPGKILEMGCAHGGSVALMKWAGFDASGLELSPWVVEFARNTFDIKVLQGPIQTHDLDEKSFDVICMFDVLEHLNEPLKTLRHCADLLKPEGFFLIQTPEIPMNPDYEMMLRNKDSRLNHLHEEHIFIFSKKAVGSIFERVGFPEIQFMDPLFWHDMFFVASRQPLTINTVEKISANLDHRPSGRLINAMLELEKQTHSLKLENKLILNQSILKRIGLSLRARAARVFKRK